MTRRQIVSIFGMLALVLCMNMGDGGLAFRIFAALLLLAAGTVEFFARMPVKGMLWLLRLFSVCVGLFFVLCMLGLSNADQAFRQLLLGFAAPFFVLAVGPSFRREVRDRIYMVFQWGGCGILGYVLSQSRDGMSLIGFPAAQLLVLQIALNKWRKSPPDYVEAQLNGLRAAAQTSIRALHDVPPTWKRLAKRWADLRLRSSLAGSRGLDSVDGVTAKLSELCRRYPQLAVTWQLAYSAHMRAGNFGRAADVLIEARVHGVDDSSYYRALARAMYLDHNGMWREILDEGWAKANEEGMGQNRAQYFSISDDPTESWRNTDPLFDHFRARLGLTVGTVSSAPLNLSAAEPVAL